MKRRPGVGVFAAATTLLCAMLWGPAPAEAQTPRAPVVSVAVNAPAALEGPVREAISLRVGDTYEVADLRRTLQNIYALGSVSDVQVSSEAVEGGVRLAFVVLPAARLREIRFVGDRPVRKSALDAALTVRLGDRVVRGLLEQQADNVQLALSSLGYQQARVEPELVLDPSGLQATLLFHLAAGAPTTLQRLEFVGDLGIGEAAARAAFSLQEGGVFRTDQLGESLDRLRRRLAEDHFFYAQVSIAQQAASLQDNTADLRVSIEAGPRVQLNLRGGFSEQQLRAMLPFFDEVSVADWILNQARSDIIAGLQQQGYWKPLVIFGRRRDEQGRNIEVNFSVLPAESHDIARVEIHGAQNLAAPDLVKLMQTRERGMLRGAPFITTVWEQDQRSILAEYRRNGFLDARIANAEVTQDDALGGLRAALTIVEGDRTTVSQVELDIRADLADYGIDVSGWPNQLSTRGGGPHDPDSVREDETKLRVLLANQGFRRALVTSQIVPQDTGRVSVTFTIVPGERVRVGQLLISGNQRVREEIIRRELSLVPGSPFTQQSVILSQSGLYQLGLFSRVDIDTARPDATDSEPTIVVRVQEGTSKRLSWGGGYSTEEQVRGLIVVGQDNLWGRNHRATVSVRASFAEQRGRFIYTNPYLLGRHLEGSLVGYYESVDQEGFKLQSFGASAQVIKRHSLNLTSIGRYSFRNQHTFDVLIDEDLLEPEDRDAVVGSLIYSLLSDTRPNPIDPAGGRYHTVDVELADKRLGSESDFVKFFARSYWYWSPTEDTVVVAAGRAGLAIPYGGSIVPLPERFLAGGSTTLRGFGRNLAGPTDDNGTPLGGNVLLIGNVEYRFPVRANLGASLFFDVGNVFADTGSVSLSEIRETIGVGVRYATPIGPLRFDWGYLVDARTGEDRTRLHFAIGQAF